MLRVVAPVLFLVAYETLAAEESAAPTPPRSARIVPDDLEPSKCGLYCAQLGATLVGEGGDHVFDVSGAPVETLADLQTLVEGWGLHALAVAWKDGEAPECSINSPAILPVAVRGQPHFVLVAATDHQHLLVCDFPFAPRWESCTYLRERLSWNGASLHIARDGRHLSPVVRSTGAGRRHLTTAFLAILVVLILAAVRRFYSWRGTASEAEAQ
jgi:hypothetical protein